MGGGGDTQSTVLILDLIQRGWGEGGDTQSTVLILDLIQRSETIDYMIYQYRTHCNCVGALIRMNM